MFCTPAPLLSRAPLLLWCFVAAACHDGAKQTNDPDDTTSASETDQLTDLETDTSTADTDLGWQGVTLTSLKAPTRTTVEVIFGQDPGSELAGQLKSYSLRRGEDALAIEEATYDPDTRTARLTTQTQVLGISYMLEILEQGEPVSGLTGVFRSADTATFWVADWNRPGMEELQITARREAIGDKCVIYVEQGQPASRAEAAAEAFDAQIYDLETATFTSAPDQDGNERITLLWLDGQGYFGGYFNPINTYPTTITENMWGIHSNEMELLHLDAGTMQAGLDYFVQIAAHEFQHLLYNKRHGNQAEYWAYHDEGLAEMAVHLVNGNNDYAVDFFFEDNKELIGDGLSLVNWNYALYENYALAYLFWTYTAGQLGSLEAIGDIFDLAGSPDDINAYLEANLGAGLPVIHQRSLVSAWAQQEDGLYSFGGLLSLEGRTPPTVPVGSTSMQLEPFTGAFFPLATSEVDYPGTQGENIEYVGIDAAGNVDTEAPFNVAGGALLTYNTRFEHLDYPTEHSGPDQAAIAPAPAQARSLALLPRTWTDPPPVTPQHRHLLEAWRLRFHPQ